MSEEDVVILSEVIKPHTYINIIVGKYLSKVISDLRKAQSESEDIRVDYNASFTIPSKVWNDDGTKLPD